MKAKSLFVLFFFFCSLTSFSQQWLETQKVIPSDRGIGDGSFNDFEISGDYGILGSSHDDEGVVGSVFSNLSGSAYFFKKGLGGDWEERQKVIASDRHDLFKFGNSVAIQGTLAVVGAPGNDFDELGQNDINFAGAVHIFELDGSGSWVEIQKLVAPDRSELAQFGISVKFNGDFLAVGAHSDDLDDFGLNYLESSGSVYLFKRDLQGNWNFSQKLVAGDRAINSQFGLSLSFEGDYLAVGAPYDKRDENGLNPLDSLVGAVYLFENNGMGQFAEVNKLVASDRENEDNFGSKLDLEGDDLLVGAKGQDYDHQGNNFESGAGACYVFQRNGGGVWSQTQKLLIGSRNVMDRFGSSISVENGIAAIGAQAKENYIIAPNSEGNFGSVYMFYRQSNGLWIEKQRVQVSDPDWNDGFGSLSSMSNGNLWVFCNGDNGISSDPAYIPGNGTIYNFKVAQVYGTVFNDFDGDCQWDLGESSLWNVAGIVNPGNICVQTLNGNWFVESLPTGNYTVTFDTTGHWESSCQNPVSFVVVSPDSVVEVSDFGMYSTQPCAEPAVSIYMPFIRPCFDNQNIYIEVCNFHSATGGMTDSWVDIQLDSLLTVQSANFPFIDLGNGLFQFMLDTLIPGSCQNILLETELSCDAVLGQFLCMEASVFPIADCMLDTIPSPPSPIGGVSPCLLPWDKSSLSVDGWCSGDSVFFTITNTGDFGDGDMDCFSEIRIFVDGVVVSIDSLMIVGGAVETYVFLGEGLNWHFEVDQHPLHPGNSHPNANVGMCGDTTSGGGGNVNNFPQDDADPILDMFCGEIRGSYDPNDKRGFPLGLTEENHILPGQDLEYVIRFQNTGTDTAFRVVIRDTLSTNLDIFSVVSGVSSHPYQFRIYGPRVLEWTFYPIHLPDSFVNSIESNGFVTFKVNQVADLVPGTEIDNSAAIYFDFNDPVITNVSNHEINLNLPVSCSTESIVSLSGNTLISSSIADSYHWLDCDGSTIVSSSADAEFTPEESGNYALIISSALCSDTSECFTIDIVGQSEDLGSESGVRVFPNPAKDKLNITFHSVESEVEMILFSIQGREILHHINEKNVKTDQIDLSGISSGVYFLELRSLDRVWIKKVVIDK